MATDSVYLGGTAALTDTGREQAKFIAERAAHLPIDVIITSTFLRATQTASIISERTGIRIEHSELLVERKSPTRLLGMRWLDPDVQETQRKWERAFYTDERVDDGETFSEICDRAQKALSFLESRSESNILVVTHGFFLRVLVADMIFGTLLTAKIFEPMDFGMRTKNTGLTVLQHDGNDTYKPWWLLVWNDHAHLG